MILGRFQISGDPRRFLSLEAARMAAQAASLWYQCTIEAMWCDDTWKPRVCVGRATAGVWLATYEGREWAFNAGYEKDLR
jgi:hypothetical protein